MAAEEGQVRACVQIAIDGRLMACLYPVDVQNLLGDAREAVLKR